MKLQTVLVVILVLGLIIPVHAQSTSPRIPYSDAVKEATECKKAVDKDPSKTEAEKIVAKRKCASDSSSKTVGNIEGKNRRLYELRVKNLIQCETWFDNYKIATLENFKILKPRQLADDCIALYQDEIWSHKGNDRQQILLDKAEELGLFQVAKIKAQLPETVSPPLKQTTQGIPKTHVDCKEGFVLIYKIVNKRPACVILDSVDMLIQRGWGSLRLPL